MPILQQLAEFDRRYDKTIFSHLSICSYLVFLCICISTEHLRHSTYDVKTCYFPFYPRDALHNAVFAVQTCLCVYLSSLSLVGIVSKQINLS